MYGPPPRHSARRRRVSVEQPTQLAAVVLQIFVQGVDDKPNKLIESYKFEITYVDGLAQVRVSEEETGRSLAPKVEQTSVETMKRTFQVVRSSPEAVGRERPLRHTSAAQNDPSAGRDSEPDPAHQHLRCSAGTILCQPSAALHGR